MPPSSDLSMSTEISSITTSNIDINNQCPTGALLTECRLVGVTSSLFTMDRFGRRPLLMLGSFFMTISHIIIAVMVCIFSYDWESHQVAAWLSVAFLFFYMIVFGASWGPVPWALPSEIFRTDLRAKGVALSTCSNWL